MEAAGAHAGEYQHDREGLWPHAGQGKRALVVLQQRVCRRRHRTRPPPKLKGRCRSCSAGGEHTKGEQQGGFHFVRRQPFDVRPGEQRAGQPERPPSSLCAFVGCARLHLSKDAVEALARRCRMVEENSPAARAPEQNLCRRLPWPQERPRGGHDRRHGTARGSAEQVTKFE